MQTFIEDECAHIGQTLAQLSWTPDHILKALQLQDDDFYYEKADLVGKVKLEERLAVYDYCVQQLKAQGKMANIERDEVLTTDWEKIIKKVFA
nr:hypothetical protein BaRGS_024300 [Batillaria attramentaria]